MHIAVMYSSYVLSIYIYMLSVHVCFTVSLQFSLVYEYLMSCFKSTFLHMLGLYKKLKKLVQEITGGTLDELPAVDEELISLQAEEKNEKTEEDKEGEKLPPLLCNDDGDNNGDNDGDNEEGVASSTKRRTRKRKSVNRRIRQRIYCARIMKALEGVALKENEGRSYSFDENDFKPLLKVS